MWWWTFGSVPEISAASIYEECVRDDVVHDTLLVDVRTEGEYQRGRIKGAVSCSLVPPWSFQDRLGACLDSLDAKWREEPKRRILFICLSAHRSISAVKLLTEMGRPNVFQLQGGMQAWRALNFPEISSTPTSNPSE